MNRASAKLSAAWTEFVSGSLDSKTIKGFLDGTTDVIEALGNMGTAALGILGYVGAAKLPALTRGLSSLRTELKYLAQGFKKGEDGTSALGRAMQTTQGKIAAAQVGVAALTTVVMVAVSAYNSWRTAQEESLSSAAENAKKTTSNYERLVDLIGQYKTLTADGEIGVDTGKQAEARSIQEQIVDLVGEQAGGIDLVNGALETQLGLLQGILGVRQQMTVDDLKAASNVANNALTALMNDPWSDIGGFNGFTAETEKMKDFIDGLEHIDYFRNNMGRYGVDFSGISGLTDATEALDELTLFRNYMQENGMETSDVYMDVNKAIGEYTEKVNQARTAEAAFIDGQLKLKAGADATAESVEKAASAIITEGNLDARAQGVVWQRVGAYNAKRDAGASGAGTSGTGDDSAVAKNTSALNDYTQAVNTHERATSLLTRAQNEMNASGSVSEKTYNALLGTFRQLNPEFAFSKDAVMQDGEVYKFAAGALQQYATEEKEWAKEWTGAKDDVLNYSDGISEAADQYALLFKAQEEQARTGKICSETYDKLTDRFGDAAIAADKLTDGYRLTTGALDELKNKNAAALKSFGYSVEENSLSQMIADAMTLQDELAGATEVIVKYKKEKEKPDSGDTQCRSGRLRQRLEGRWYGRPRDRKDDRPGSETGEG